MSLEKKEFNIDSVNECNQEIDAQSSA